MAKTWLDRRDNVLDTIFGTKNQAVLNPHPLKETELSAAALVQALNQTMHQFKAEAFNASGSKADYQKLRTSQTYQSFTETLIPQLRAFDLTQFQSEAEARAFWINLYNVLVIHAVIATQVQRSVTEASPLAILGFFRRAAYQIGGYLFRLDDIEHGILRNNAGIPYIPGAHFSADDPRQAFVLPLDPRIHFALNCASASCPPVGVYTAPQLETQLTLATRNFLRHEISLDKTALCLSKIFLWYRKDFGERATLFAFLRTYTMPEFWGDSSETELEIKYDAYNWQLNT